MLQRLHLVRVEPVDPGGPQGLLQRLGQRGIGIGVMGHTGGNALDVHDVPPAHLPMEQGLQKAVELLKGAGLRKGGGDERALHARSSLTCVPERTALNAAGSPWTLPRMLTALAARGRSSVLAGVRPKKMQKALPGGQ